MCLQLLLTEKTSGLHGKFSLKNARLLEATDESDTAGKSAGSKEQEQEISQKPSSGTQLS